MIRFLFKFFTAFSFVKNNKKNVLYYEVQEIILSNRTCYRTLNTKKKQTWAVTSNFERLGACFTAVDLSSDMWAPVPSTSSLRNKKNMVLYLPLTNRAFLKIGVS